LWFWSFCPLLILLVFVCWWLMSDEWWFRWFLHLTLKNWKLNFFYIELNITVFELVIRIWFNHISYSNQKPNLLAQWM
jgi:hypothetical protein